MKDFKKQEIERLTRDFDYDLEKERKLKDSIEKQKKDEKKHLIDYKLHDFKEEEKINRDKYMTEKLSLQKEREVERKKEISK